jgi:hypothetical protein
MPDWLKPVTYKQPGAEIKTLVLTIWCEGEQDFDGMEICGCVVIVQISSFDWSGLDVYTLAKRHHQIGQELCTSL